jgi:hypothetical protein
MSVGLQSSLTDSTVTESAEYAWVYPIGQWALVGVWRGVCNGDWSTGGQFQPPWDYRTGEGTRIMKAVHAVAGPDGLLIALVVGIVGLLIGIGCLAAVVFTNFGSRTLVGAFTATFAAALALLIAIYFDLRGKTQTAAMAAEYTVDLSKPQIRQWAYPDGVGWRLGNEVGASEALAKSNPGAFKGDLGKLTVDMTIRSVLAYFFAEQFDWQLKQTRVQGATTGTWIL